MEKLSISSLRKLDGVTELYAEAINYAYTLLSIQQTEI
jgi:hypothetical protein